MSSFPSNSSSSNSNIDNYLLETIMERLQLRDPVNNPLVTQSLEDYLYGDFDYDEDDGEIAPFEEGREDLIKEERKLEKEVIKIILSGKGDTLKPNSGQAVSVRDHNICVGCQEDDEGDYMVWEWHGHIMAYTEQYGYSPEYIYGSYFQRLKPQQRPSAAAEKDEEDDKGDQGLKDLVDGSKASGAGRILHRNVNAASPSESGAARLESVNTNVTAILGTSESKSLD